MAAAKTCNKQELHQLILRYSLGLGISGRERRTFEAHYLECEACCEELRQVDADVKRWRKDRIVGENLKRWFLKEAGLSEAQIKRIKSKQQPK